MSGRLPGDEQPPRDVYALTGTRGRIVENVDDKLLDHHRFPLGGAITVAQPELEVSPNFEACRKFAAQGPR